jgi:hypothetical protein
MNKLIFVSCLVFGALGCLGGDPNMNSQYYGDAAPATTGAGGSGTGGSGVLGMIPGVAYATFDSTALGFILDDYMDSDPTMYTNISNQAEWASKGKTPPALSFNMDDGSPTPGSLQVVAPFDGKNQHFDIQSPSLSPVRNWSGGTLHVRIRVAQGSLGAGAGAQLFIKTTATYVYGGTYVNFPMTGQTSWHDFSMSLDAPVTMNSGYDASMAISYGVQVNTGSSVTSQGPATIEFDSFSVSGIATGTGGAGGGAAGGAGGSGGGGGTSGTGGSGDASTGN